MTDRYEGWTPPGPPRFRPGTAAISIGFAQGMPGASLESTLTILVPILHVQGRPGSIEACRALQRSGRPSGAPGGVEVGRGIRPAADDRVILRAQATVSDEIGTAETLESRASEIIVTHLAGTLVY